MRTLVLDGLTLEPQLAAHAAEMFVVLSDPAIYAYENEPPSSIDTLTQRFARLEARHSPNGEETWLNWVVRLRPSDGQASPLMGYVQATLNPSGDCNIAYEFHSAYWGHGYATRAVQAMMDECARQHGARRFDAVLKQENLRSFHLLRRLGFTEASPEALAAADHVERDERWMQRALRTTQANPS
jgi:[ribosomal protein S5]-alanine N-acetyltransferase